MGYSPWGPNEWDTAERLTHTHTHTHSGVGTFLLGTRPWPAPPSFSLLCALECLGPRLSSLKTQGKLIQTEVFVT